jgi:hypothetical protein
VTRALCARAAALRDGGTRARAPRIRLYAATGSVFKVGTRSILASGFVRAKFVCPKFTLWISDVTDSVMRAAARPALDVARKSGDVECQGRGVGTVSRLVVGCTARAFFTERPDGTWELRVDSVHATDCLEAGLALVCAVRPHSDLPIIGFFTSGRGTHAMTDSVWTTVRETAGSAAYFWPHTCRRPSPDFSTALSSHQVDTLRVKFLWTCM